MAKRFRKARPVRSSAGRQTKKTEMNDSIQVFKEALADAERWEAHYKSDEEGRLDEAYWRGKVDAFTSCLHYVETLPSVLDRNDASGLIGTVRRVCAALRESTDLGPTIGDGVVSWPLGAEILSRLEQRLEALDATSVPDARAANQSQSKQETAPSASSVIQGEGA